MLEVVPNEPKCNLDCYRKELWHVVVGSRYLLAWVNWQSRYCLRLTNNSNVNNHSEAILSSYSVSCAVLAVKLCDLMLMLTPFLTYRCGERSSDCRVIQR